MKFGYLTDTHLSAVTPESRHDDYLTSILSKLRDAYAFFENEGCAFVAHGGDVFHTHRTSSLEMLRGVWRFFHEQKLITYFILGQHDLFGYNFASFPKSTLSCIEEISLGKLRFIDEQIMVDGVRLCACNVYDDPIVKASTIAPMDGVPTVLLCHALLTDKDNGLFDVVTTKTMPNGAAKLVLSGDLHSGYKKHEIDGVTYYNPGAFGRTSSHCKNRVVKCATITIDEMMTGHSFAIKEHEPVQIRGEDVFKAEEAPSSIKVKIDFKGFDEFAGKSGGMSNIFQLIELAGRGVVSEDVLEYIKTFKDKQPEAV